MSAPFLVQGLLVGFSIAAPVGAIGALCIQRTLAGGRRLGLASGLGAATADALYGCVGGFGLTFISGFLVGQQFWLRLVGGLFLCYLGTRTFWQGLRTPLQSPGATGVPVAYGLWGAYVSTLALTLANPSTILSYATIMAGLGIGVSTHNYASAGLWVSGVFLGSATWWLLLSTGVDALRARFAPGTTVGRALLRWVNPLAGIVIVGMGILALLATRA
jgi:threonine/homoserine/homoserine lactone efflux protein